MPRWLHRTDKELLNSVAEADLPRPVAAYIEEPDLSAVTGQPKRYWVITGDVVSFGDQVTRDAIDAQLAADEAKRQRDEANAPSDNERQDRRFLALLDLLVDEINLLRAAGSPPLTPPRTLNQYMTQLRNRINGQD